MPATPGQRPRHRLVLSGPVGQRDALLLLAAAPVLATAKVPMGFLALLALPLVVVVIHGIRPRAQWPGMLRATFAIALLSSLFGALLTDPLALPSPTSSFMVVAAPAAVALAVFAGGRRAESLRALSNGIEAGLLLVWAISILEVVTGFKFMTVLYPTSNTVSVVKSNRLFVSALFPNFNDYSVAITYLCLMLVAALVHHPRVPLWRTAGRLVVLLSSTFFIVVMGSRGCLAALAAGIAIISIGSIRRLHPRAIGPRLVLIGAAIAMGAAAALASSSYVQDNSTQQRGRIAQNVWQMLLDDPSKLLFGWGSQVSYTADATARYGTLLMDPHNVLLELVIWYGVLTLLCYLVCWWLVVRNGVLRRRDDLSWQSVAAITITALMPLIGIVCSSTLRSHLFWLWLVLAMGGLQRQTRPQQTEGPTL